MKALTLTEPWATLVAIQAKNIETRSWRTFATGQRIAIHAAKGMTRADWDYTVHTPAVREALGAEILLAALQRTVKDSFTATRGCVIATARLIACASILPDGVLSLKGRRIALSDRERVFGDYAPGRYAWLLEDVIRLPEPIPATGALGLWEWDPPDVEEVAE